MCSSDLDERIADALFRLPVGTSSRIFEGKGFFQLVVAVEREDGGAAKFETIQPQIEKRLADENRVQEMERVVGELQLTAQITTVFDKPGKPFFPTGRRSEEHTSELQSLVNLVCRLLLEKKKQRQTDTPLSYRRPPNDHAA